MHIMGHCRENSKVSKPVVLLYAASGLQHTPALIHIIHHIPLLIKETKHGSETSPASPAVRLFSTR